MAAMGSTLLVEVVPAVATTQKGFRPAASSAAMASARASGRMRNSASTGILRTFFWPMPSAIAPFSMEECDCSEVYKTRPGRAPFSRASGSAISRAAASAWKLLTDAVS
jgi:hypothetical protein